MPWSESLYPWLGYSAVVSLAVLVLGCGGVLLCRQPARRLRIIELTLAGCLISPLLAIIPGYPHLSVGIWAAVPLQRQAVSTPSPAEPAALGSHLQPPAAPSPVRTLPPSSVAEPPVRGWNVASWIVVLYLSGVAVAVFCGGLWAWPRWLGLCGRPSRRRPAAGHFWPRLPGGAPTESAC